MFRYLQSWIAQLRWQRLPAFDQLAAMLVDHLDGLLNHCRTPVRFGMVEAINGNIKALLRRGRGYTNRAICCSRPSASRRRRPISSPSRRLHEYWSAYRFLLRALFHSIAGGVPGV
jgi:hypothetical protein